MAATGIKNGMEVISADGVHVGKVDHLDGDRIKLAKQDRGSGGKHHYISEGLVAEIEGDKVRLSVSLENTDFFEEES
jgi:hypothetical protein